MRTRKLIAIVVFVILYSFFFVQRTFAVTPTPDPSIIQLHWKFDEGSGSNAIDSSTYGRDGTLFNTPTYTSGEYDGGLLFNGTNQYVKLNSATNLLKDVDGAYTVAAWVKVASGEIGGNIVTVTDGGSWCVPVLQIFFSRFRAVSWENGNAATAMATSGFTANQWYHVATTWSNTTGLKLYVNGVFNQAGIEDIFDASGNLNYIYVAGDIPGCAQNQGYFSGAVDDVRFYARALDSTEMLALAATPTPTPTASPTPTPTNTPTPSPTRIPTATPTPGSASTAQILGSTTEPPVCRDAKPNKRPELFAAISRGAHDIELYFTDDANPYDHISLEYGTRRDVYQFGATNIGGNGIRQYVVGGLQQNSRYYFRVSAVNGCMTSGWSNEISATTKANVVLNSLTFEKSELKAVPTPTPRPQKNTDVLGTVSPTLTEESPTPTPSKKTYELKIHVKNTNGLPVTGAKVTLHSKIQTTLTNSQGVATFKNVEVGEHDVKIEAKGFSGEQKINLTGSNDAFDLNLTVKPKTFYLSPQAWGIIVALILLVILLIYKKRRK